LAFIFFVISLIYDVGSAHPTFELLTVKIDESFRRFFLQEAQYLLDTHYRLLLISGASHVGKSTLAQSLATHFAWDYCSTDRLARHPGRPWQANIEDIPKHVADHYQSLSPNELIDDVLQHYRKNVWPLIENRLTLHAAAGSQKMIIEGSALLPELLITRKFGDFPAIWLTASNDFLRQRIYTSSQYETKTIDEKTLIDKFVQRNDLFNDRITETVNRLELLSLNVEDASTPEALMSLCLSILAENMS
jgi:2-phosphoglycerate kinase